MTDRQTDGYFVHCNYSALHSYGTRMPTRCSEVYALSQCCDRFVTKVRLIFTSHLPVRSSRQTVASFYRHQSSSGATVKRSTAGSRAFPVVGPKTWKALPEDVTSSQSEYTFRRQLKTWLFQEVFSVSDTDCLLTFSLGLSVPTLRRFCRLRTTIWYGMIRYLTYIVLNNTQIPWMAESETHVCL